ncbi:MAG: copper resistance protein CopC [Acidimicrobiia bacterium]|nr:copper resistance protein CopC [Acidimicrobiia bacterium]
MLVALLLVTLVAGAGPAFAHASLVSTDPLGGTVLTVSPPTIELRFSESVTLVSGSMRLFDGRGTEMSLPKLDHSDSSVLRVAPPDLPSGAYVVAWRVVSADGHPVHGAFTFRVGVGEQASPTLIARLLSQGGGSSLVGALLSVARFLNFVAVAVVVGGLVISAGLAEANGRGRRIMVIAGLSAAVAGAAALALQSPYVTGGPLGDVFKGSAWREVFHSRTGWTWVVRIAVVAGLAAVAGRVGGRQSRVGAGLAGGAVLFATEAWSGHGATGRWTVLGFVATLVHLAAVSVWFGGLVFLMVHLGERDRDPERANALARQFSRWATASVVALVISGSFQGWRQLGSFGAITSSTYGRLLLIKVVAVGAMLLAAISSRRIALATDAEGIPPLRNPVTVEVLFGVVVFALTSLLVVAQPVVATGDRTLTRTLVQGTTLADVTVTPLHSGVNTIHVTISSTGGGLLDVPTSVTMTLELPARDLGPLDVPVEPAGPGHVTALVQIPFSGHWNLTITATYDRFTEKQFVLPVDVH